METKKSEALVLVRKVETTIPFAYMVPTTEEVWLTFSRDKKLLEKGGIRKLHRLFNHLKESAEIAMECNQAVDRPLGKVAKGANMSVADVKSILTRVCRQLRELNINIGVMKDRTGLRDGVYHTAKRGNPIVGVTLNPLKNAPIEVIRELHEGMVNPLQLAAYATAGSLHG